MDAAGKQATAADMGADPYAGMSDDQVFTRAHCALQRVTLLAFDGVPPGDVRRAVQMGAYYSASAELKRRMHRNGTLDLITRDSQP